MIGDHYQDKWTDDYYKKFFPHYEQSPHTLPIPSPNITYIPPGVSLQEFNDLRKEVQEMKQLLIRAKIYDEKNNEPNCELEDKIAILKKVAELVGVNLDDVFGPKKDNEQKT